MENILFYITVILMAVVIVINLIPLLVQTYRYRRLIRSDEAKAVKRLYIQHRLWKRSLIFDNE